VIFEIALSDDYGEHFSEALLGDIPTDPGLRAQAERVGHRQ
jgi:hypothetical protein